MSAKYIGKLGQDQYLQLARELDSTVRDIHVVSAGERGVNVKAVTPFIEDDGTEGLAEDFYAFEDYTVEAYDSIVHWEDILAYRKLMLEWFGDEYARDFLLKESWD